MVYWKAYFKIGMDRSVNHFGHFDPSSGGSSLTNEKDHHYFLNRFVCVGEFFDG